VDARKAVQAAGHMPLVGNVNNPETLLRGTAADVEREARYAVEAGVRVVGPECAVPLRTPIENLQAIHRAVEPIG
jgi:[methyl-Co(III) methanol-specific corrinoid protein]:coenzyme M methyltransferase